MAHTNPLAIFRLPDNPYERNINALMEVNPVLQARGFFLTQAEAGQILEAGARILSSLGRYEIDTLVLQDIASRLTDSAFVSREGFVRAVEDLYEVFHSLKNQTSDQVDDADLLDALFVFYDWLEGSIDLLLGKGAEKIMENHRRGVSLTETGKLEEEKQEDEAYWHSQR